MLEYTLFGDLDQDNNYSKQDVYKILESLPSKQISFVNGVKVETDVIPKELTKTEKKLADVDNDNIATGRDANFIEQYLLSKQNYLNGVNDLFVKEAFPLVEYLAFKNNLKLLQEVDKYKDLEMQNVRRELLKAGATDKEIISTWLYDQERDKPEINIEEISQAEIIEQMLFNNIDKNLDFDIDNSGNITNNDYLIARGLTPDNNIKEVEAFIMSEVNKINEDNLINDFKLIDFEPIEDIEEPEINLLKLPLPSDEDFFIPSAPSPIDIKPIGEPIEFDEPEAYPLPYPPILPLPENEEDNLIDYKEPINPTVPTTPINPNTPIVDNGNKINIDKNLLIVGALVIGLLIARGK